MISRPARYILLALFVCVTVPPLARLCRGRTPSLLAPANLPVWERQVPRSMPLRGKLAVSPAPPGSVSFPDPTFVRNGINADEDALLVALEHPHADPTGDGALAGRWLEMACALGRRSRTVAAKQDRVAGRILATQLTNGWFGTAPKPGTASAAAWNVQAACLRGLACYTRLTHNPAALYAAWQGAQTVVCAPFSPANKNRLILPMLRVYALTGDASLLHWCEHKIQNRESDTAGLCALYAATGQKRFLRAAEMRYKRNVRVGQPDPDGAAALFAETGGASYRTVMETSGPPFACPLLPGTLCYSRIPLGISLNIAAPSQAVFGRVRLVQTVAGTGATRRMTVRVFVATPTAFKLRLPQGITGAQVNGTVLAPPASSILRRWHNGDTVSCTLTVPPVARHNKPKPL